MKNQIKVEPVAARANSKFAAPPFLTFVIHCLEITRLITSFAVRTFKQMLALAERNDWQNEKQRNVISPAFLNKLSHRTAPFAATRVRSSLRAGNVKLRSNN
jgi:hypothetical protein